MSHLLRNPKERKSRAQSLAHRPCCNLTLIPQSCSLVEHCYNLEFIDIDRGPQGAETKRIEGAENYLSTCTAWRKPSMRFSCLQAGCAAVTSGSSLHAGSSRTVAVGEIAQDAPAGWGN